MILNLPGVAALKGVKDDIAQIYLFITMLLKYIKTLSTWLNSIPLGNELYSPADLCLIALNASGLTLPETTVCTKLRRLLLLQNRASLRSGLQSRKISFPSASPHGIWSSIVHQPQSQLMGLWEHFLVPNVYFILAEEKSTWMSRVLGGGQKRVLMSKGEKWLCSLAKRAPSKLTGNLEVLKTSRE